MDNQERQTENAWKTAAKNFQENTEKFDNAQKSSCEGAVDEGLKLNRPSLLPPDDEDIPIELSNAISRYLCRYIFATVRNCEKIQLNSNVKNDCGLWLFVVR